MKKITADNSFSELTKRERTIFIFLISISLIIGIFALIFFSKGMLKTSSKDYIKLQGIVINYERYTQYDKDGYHTLYKEIVEYSVNNEKHIFKNPNGTGIKPQVGRKFDLLYNNKTGEVYSGEYNDRMFPLFFFPAMFILIPMVMIMAIKGKRSSYLIGGIFAFIPFLVISYISASYNTWNIFYIISKYPPILIPLIMFCVGCYIFIYPLLYNSDRPKYIKVTLTDIKNNHIAYFNGGWRTGFASMYHYKIKDSTIRDFFEVGKVYKVNIAKLGIISNDATNLSALNKSDFVKID